MLETAGAMTWLFSFLFSAPFKVLRTLNRYTLANYAWTEQQKVQVVENLALSLKQISRLSSAQISANVRLKICEDKTNRKQIWNVNIFCWRS